MLDPNEGILLKSAFILTLTLVILGCEHTEDADKNESNPSKSSEVTEQHFEAESLKNNAVFNYQFRNGLTQPVKLEPAGLNLLPAEESLSSFSYHYKVSGFSLDEADIKTDLIRVVLNGYSTFLDSAK